MGTAAHLKKYQFKPGNHQGGRPVGSRNKLSETMLALLQADAAEHGAEVIQRVRETDPSTWLRCMCALLPKQLQVEKFSPLGDLSDEELTMVHEHLRAARARTVRELARHNGAVLEHDPDPLDDVAGRQCGPV